MKKHCLKCNKSFEKPEYCSVLTWIERKFCSQRCYGDSLIIDKPIKITKPRILKVVGFKNCEKCSKEFTKKWPFELKKARFCSQECANSVRWLNLNSEQKQKISLSLQRGREKFVYTPEVRSKMSKIKKEQFSNGVNPWNRGKTGVYSEESLKRITEANIKNGKKMLGENHPNWKGGQSVVFVRKQRIAENGGSHTHGEWETLKAQYNWTCPCCNKKEPEIKLSLDHVIPLAKGGSDNIENIQPLCRSCNAKKHTTIIRYELVEK